MAKTDRVAGAIRRRRWAEVSELLTMEAGPLAAQGRFDAIERWVSTIPEEVLLEDLALSYWGGIAVLTRAPALARDRFRRAFDLSRAQHDDLGAWRSLAALCEAEIFVYRDLQGLDEVLSWMTPDREQGLDRLPRLIRAPIVCGVLMGLAFRQPNHPRIEDWRTRAEKLVEEDPTAEISGRLAFALVTNATWRGDLAGASLTRERFHAARRVGPSSPQLLVLEHLVDATHYLHTGEIAAGHGAIHAGLKASEMNAVHIWDGVLRCHGASIACSAGDLAGARAHLEALTPLLATALPIDESYRRGMLAWIRFLEDQGAGVVSDCGQSIQSADVKGVPYFQGVCRVGCALMLHHAGEREAAWEALNRGAEFARDLGNRQLEWASLLFRAHMHYRERDALKGDAALIAAMRIGHSYRYRHFFMWPGEIIRDLIDRCFLLDEEVETAADLARFHRMRPPSQYARSDRWPFDVRIFTFGQPRIQLADGREIALSSRAPRQAEFLASLIERGGRPVRLQELAEEREVTSRATAAAKTDARLNAVKQTIHGLRKVLGKHLEQKNGAVRLNPETVWVDALSLRQLQRSASDPRGSERWAHRYYHGTFMQGVPGSDTIDRLRTDFDQLISARLRASR
ncbi:MAG: helix-turn-helix domain-containing protein [Deltaproteobacteria bacterium]|nr:helix-turn-helix domain-containing protein [Deltaproteobacteria bacterium]